MIRIPTHLQGPTDTGQGGWSSAKFVAAIQSELTTDKPTDLTVAIRSPIPLETDLTIRGDDGGWDLIDASLSEPAAILRAEQWSPAFATTEPVGIAAARSARGRFPLTAETHPVPLCFSCGLHEASMQVHSGPLDDGRYATDWRVPSWAVDTDGSVDDAVLWAAIDCAAAWYVGCSQVTSYRAAFTVQLAVEILQPLRPDEDYALVSWQGDFDDAWDGRKRGAASAAFDTTGLLVAHAHSFWIAAA